MLHLAAFQGAQAFGVNLVQLNAAPEQVLVTQNNQFLFNKQLSIVGAYAIGPKITRCQLNIPSYRSVALPELHPLELAANPLNNPNIIDLRDSPYILRASETLGVLTSNNATVGTDQEFVGVWLTSSGLTQIPAGQYYSVRFTAAITAVANAWTIGALTATQQLPPGVYTVIGAQIQSATGVLARLVFPGQLYRPGVIACTSLGNRGPYQEKPGMWGALGNFNTVTYPQLEIMCTAADTAQIVNLDCIYQPNATLQTAA